MTFKFYRWRLTLDLYPFNVDLWTTFFWGHLSTSFGADLKVSILEKNYFFSVWYTSDFLLVSRLQELFLAMSRGKASARNIENPLGAVRSNNGVDNKSRMGPQFATSSRVKFRLFSTSLWIFSTGFYLLLSFFSIELSSRTKHPFLIDSRMLTSSGVLLFPSFDSRCGTTS